MSNENEYYIKKISKTLETLVVSTTKQQSTQTYINIHSIFYCNDIPPISLNDYLIRIQKYTNIELSTLICALIYVDRFTSIGNIKIDFNNIHKILFAAVLLSIKYNEDLVYTNEYYSLIAGIPLKEMNQIEYEFLNQINFNLFINEDLYNTYNKLF
jgi:hypothetical protein